MSVMTVATTGRLLSVDHGAARPLDLPGHIGNHGPLAIPAGDDPSWGAGMFRAVAASGLLGRGGAGFPAAAKWDTLRRDPRRPMVVVNAMEGEPASDKDRVLLTHSPHLVLDGAAVAAAAIGASEIVICVADDNPSAASSIEGAIEERRQAGMAGRRTSVARPPGRYVTGEESALVSWLNHRPALPFLRIDKSVPLRVARRPALVHNAETLSQIALIARHGPEWFRRAGTPEAPGSTLVTVTGAVRCPGVLEVEVGAPVAEILGRVGVDVELSAVLLGGYGGAWLNASRLATPYGPGRLADADATYGVGVVIALPATSCGITETARLARYLAGESAGQCGPCVFGLPALAGDLEQLSAGRVDAEVLSRIETRSATVEGRGGCRHPDGAVRLVRSALEVFAADATAHAQGRPCSGRDLPTVLTFPTSRPPGRNMP
jgi:NADH:ubiquinone oxidoreductase subunit F (NADH-binding)